MGKLSCGTMFDLATSKFGKTNNSNSSIIHSPCILLLLLKFPQISGILRPFCLLRIFAVTNYGQLFVHIAEAQIQALIDTILQIVGNYYPSVGRRVLLLLFSIWPLGCHDFCLLSKLVLRKSSTSPISAWYYTIVGHILCFRAIKQKEHQDYVNFIE